MTNIKPVVPLPEPDFISHNHIGLPDECSFSAEAMLSYAQAVARRCAEIAEATTEYGPMDMCGETAAYATAAAIRAEFGIKEEP